MSMEKQKLGVTLLHLKDKFAYGSVNGNEISEFKFDDIQANVLFDFLYNGVFDGMFTFVELKDFQDILNLNYMNLAREILSTDGHKKLEQDFLKKEQELKEAYKKQKESETQSQPQ